MGVPVATKIESPDGRSYLGFSPDGKLIGQTPEGIHFPVVWGRRYATADVAYPFNAGLQEMTLAGGEFSHPSMGAAANRITIPTGGAGRYFIQGSLFIGNSGFPASFTVPFTEMRVDVYTAAGVVRRIVALQGAYWHSTPVDLAVNAVGYEYMNEGETLRAYLVNFNTNSLTISPISGIYTVGITCFRVTP